MFVVYVCIFFFILYFIFQVARGIKLRSTCYQASRLRVGLTVRLKEKTYKWREIRPATFINFVYSYYSVEHYTWCPSYSTILKIVPTPQPGSHAQNPSDTYFITYFFPGFHNFGPGNKYLMEGWNWDLGRWNNSQGFFWFPTWDWAPASQMLSLTLLQSLHSFLKGFKSWVKNILKIGNISR